jgi:hypothetical protein
MNNWEKGYKKYLRFTISDLRFDKTLNKKMY